MNMRKVSLDTWIQLLGMVGVLAGLILVAYELRLSNTLAKMEAASRTTISNSTARQTRLEYVEKWLIGLNDGNAVTEEEINEEVFRILCASAFFNISNNWEQDVLSNDEAKQKYRLFIAERAGSGPCYTSFRDFRADLVERGELYQPLISAFDKGFKSNE